MTIRHDDGIIMIEGVCPVEEAEVLLGLIDAGERPTVDWTGCIQLHTALLQVLLARAPVLRGPCGDPFVRRWIEPDMARSG